MSNKFRNNVLDSINNYKMFIDTTDKKNMNRIGIDMININNEESFDITINRYFRNKGKMKN